ncbi:hypothetical protein [Candidatus Binatus sp.]|jgi:hypothetical protein|uniref:hypothetical protein n=1 Tax=Candidatus Binatus sp. TaxID=2811406 RepID=UPI003C644BC4
MKLPDIYTDWKIVTGLALILLGAANWGVGLERTETYSRMIIARAQPATATDYRSFDELDEGAGGAAVLEPLTAEQRQASYATARMDFYHAAFLAGRAMVLLGLLVTLLGFISVIQQDSRRAFRRPEDDARLPRGLPGAPRAPQ